MSDLSKTNICPFCKNSKAYAEYHEREDLLMNKVLDAAIDMLVSFKRTTSGSGWTSSNLNPPEIIRMFESALKEFQEFNMDMVPVAEEVMRLEKSLSERIE